MFLPQQHFHGYSPSAGRNHWPPFQKYVAFQTRHRSIKTFQEIKNIFVLRLKDLTWNWFEPIINNIQDMASLKDTFIKRINLWGQTLQQQCTYWQKMKFHHSKHDVEQFVHDFIKVLHKIIVMSDEQVLEHFKEVF